jgi:hypothetical protein
LAQSSGLGSAFVLRTQATGVAEETIAHLGQSIADGDQVGIFVEGGSSRSLVENAFLDLLARRGFRAHLVGAQKAPHNILQVTVLDQSVRYSGLSTGDYRREVQTAIEARRYGPDSASTEYIGLFKRQNVDTVAFREDTGLARQGVEQERSLFDRLVGPVLLIGGVFLVVYLFFTVRN